MANKLQDAFDNIQAEPQLIESTRQFLSNERQKKTRRTARPAFGKVVATACMILLLTTGIGGYFWTQEAVSYVSIDVNPSIELALNRLDRVVSVKAFNAEGVEVLNGLSLKGKSYMRAIDVIVESEAMGAYLAEGEELVFTVAAREERQDELKSGVESCAGQLGHKSQSVSVDMETASQAHGCEISPGKYYAWQQLKQYDDTVTVDACRDMSMTQLYDLISEHEKDHGHEESHAEEQDQMEERSHAKEEEHVEERSHTEEKEHVEEGNRVEQQNFVEQERSAEEESHFGPEADPEENHAGNGHKKKNSHRQTQGHR